MRRFLKPAAIASLLSGALGGQAQAASLTVSPILIDGGAANTAIVNLQNKEARPLNAQVRVFRWTQENGEDRLTPAEDVVASPPILTIEPNDAAVVRLQRLTQDRPVAEAAYRVVVDELPNPNRQRNGTVAVVLRYLVPAFFFPADAGQPRVSWSVTRRDGKPMLTAINRGDKRLQLADLRLKSGGKTIMVSKGLAGYVLGHSEKSWPLGSHAGSARAASIVASSDHGPLDASLVP